VNTPSSFNPRCARLEAGVLILSAAASLLGLTGCDAFDRTEAKPATQATAKATAASFAELAKSYNQRVARLDRVWARTTLRVEGVENSGEKIDEQAEGNLQFIRPRKLALTVTKVGEPIFYLGSNDEEFWWLDIRQNHQALVGNHADATPRSVASFGVPVLPLDLIELLGLLPIDPAVNGTARTSPAGTEIFFPSRSVVVAMLLDPKTFEPKVIELRTQKGQSLLRAELLKYKPVMVPGGGVAPTMATWYKIAISGTQTKMEIRVYDAENRGDRMKEAPYKLDTLLRAYRIDDVRTVRPDGSISEADK